MITLRGYDSDSGYVYYDTEILPSGQTIHIGFQEGRSNDKYNYNIYLVISHKRRQADATVLKQTGKDGLKGLLWAKRKIAEFEEFIKTEKPGVPIIIYCWWDDNRRRDTYAKGLKPMGYRFTHLFGYKVLSKTIMPA